MLRLILVAAQRKRKLSMLDTELLLAVMEQDEATLAWFRAMGLNNPEEEYPELNGFRAAGMALSCVWQLVNRVRFPDHHPYPQHYGFWQCGGFDHHQWWDSREPLKNEMYARIVAELLRPSGLTVSKILQNTQTASMTEYTRADKIFDFVRAHGYLPQETDIFTPEEGFIGGEPRVEYVAHYGTAEEFFAVQKPQYEAYDAYVFKSY